MNTEIGGSSTNQQQQHSTPAQPVQSQSNQQPMQQNQHDNTAIQINQHTEYQSRGTPHNHNVQFQNNVRLAAPARRNE